MELNTGLAGKQIHGHYGVVLENGRRVVPIVYSIGDSYACT